MRLRTALRDAFAAHPRLDGLFRRFVWSRIHFPEHELKFLDGIPIASIDVAIDVGAALGGYCWILNRKARQVFAFEPGEAHANYLDRNVRGTKVELIKAAVGNVSELVDMYTPGTDTNALHMATLSQRNPVATESGVTVRQVRQVTLDEYFKDKLGNDRTVDLLKVDVEGYEDQVFGGAHALIERHKPLIICEIEARHNPNYRDTFGLLRAFGYEAYVYDKGRYRAFDGDAIEPLQTEGSLAERLSPQHDPERNSYLNNFVFQHPQSRLKVA